MSGAERPDRSPSSYHGSRRSSGPTQYDMKAKIDALLSTMPPQLREQFQLLAKADDATRQATLDALDAKTRLAVQLILQQIS